MTGLNAEQFRACVVRPVLNGLNLHSESAEELLIGTALVESRLSYLEQIGGGPALGVFQMEPATHDDIVTNFLSYRSELSDRVMTAGAVTRFDADYLLFNLRYAAAFARVHYLRAPGALPAPQDVRGLGAYWKQHYNTELGAGTVEKFIDAYEGGR